MPVLAARYLPVLHPAYLLVWLLDILHIWMHIWRSAHLSGDYLVLQHICLGCNLSSSTSAWSVHSVAHSVSAAACISVYFAGCLYICLLVHLQVHLQAVNLSICLFHKPCVNLFICLFRRPWFRLFIC